MAKLYDDHVHYSPATLRTYVVALLDAFNDISVRRYAKDWLTITKTIPVPIRFGAPEKEQVTREEQYNADGTLKRYYSQVPRMSLLFTGLSYDPERVSQPNGIVTFDLPTPNMAKLNEALTHISPVPFNYQFEIKIFTELVEDVQQILEQILPFQNPDRFLRVRKIPFLNLEEDIQMLIDSSDLEITNELGAEDMRVVNATLQVTLKGYMYRPIIKGYLLKTLVKELAVYNETTDRKIITSVALTEAEIPPNAINVRPIDDDNDNGVYLYEVVSL